MRVLDSCVTATIGGSKDLNKTIPLNVSYKERLDDYSKSIYNQLKLAVSKYESKASCNLFPRKIPSIASCGIALAQMPAWLQFEQFLGQMDPPTRGTYTRLPKEYTHQSAPGQSCEILVSKVPEAGSVSGRWFDIWAAGVDIWTMCVQNSMSGIVTDLGPDRRIQIEISDDPVADA
ncbi:MAG: hypothetical protein Q9188_004266 [Gyalolechia gomerana]